MSLDWHPPLQASCRRPRVCAESRRHKLLLFARLQHWELPGYTTLSSLALGQLRKLVLFLHGEHRNVCYSLLYSRHAGYRICSISQAASKGCTPLSRIWIASVCVRRVATSPLIRHVNIIMVLVRWPSSTLSSARTPRGLGDVEMRELLGLPPGEELPPAGVPLDALHLVYCDR